MLEQFGIDSSFEILLTVFGFITFILSFVFSSYLALKVLEFLGAILLIGCGLIPAYYIGQGDLNTWQQVLQASIGIGFLLAFAISPLTAFSRFESKIKSLENRLKESTSDKNISSIPETNSDRIQPSSYSKALT